MSYFEPLERVGPFLVVLTNPSAMPRTRRVVVRCVSCARISVLSERTLADKRIESQHACAKCRCYVTQTTWKKGHKHGTRAKLS